MSKLNRLEIRVIQTQEKKIAFDFFVDNILLSKQLEINRPEDLRFCDFDLDVIEIDKAKFPKYDRLKIIKRAIETFKGKEKPFNQWGTERIVLYRCHCGCDYCGVISFK